MAVYRRGKTYWYEFVFNGQRVRESSKSNSKKVATQAERQRRSELEHGYNRIPKRRQAPLFKTAAQQWLDGKRGLAQKSVHEYAQRLKPLIKHFGQQLVSDITAQDVFDYRATILDEELSHRTINYEVGCLRGVLKQYGLWGSIGDRIHSLREEHNIGKRVTDEDEANLTTATLGSWSPALATLFVLSIRAGLRRCEIKSLKRQDLSLVWKEGVITEATIAVGKSKTPAGRRTIPIFSQTVCAMLTQWLANFPNANGEGYLFPHHRVGLKGNARESAMYDVRLDMPMGEWKNAWKTACRTAGVTYRWHDLRHTFITRLAEDPDVSEETIRSLAGHVSREMLQRYSHIRTEAKRAAVKSVEQRLLAAPEYQRSVAGRIV